MEKYVTVIVCENIVDTVDISGQHFNILFFPVLERLREIFFKFMLILKSNLDSVLWYHHWKESFVSNELACG